MIFALAGVLFFSAAAEAEDAGVFSLLDQPLYVVTQNHYSEGSGPKDAKFSDVIAVGISYPKGKDKDAAPKSKVPLFSRGKRSGELVVRKKVSVECDGSGLAVTLPKGFSFPVTGFALATSSKNVKERGTELRKASSAEDKDFLSLAKKRFSDKNDFGSYDPSGKAELLGTVYTKISKELAYLIGTVKSTSEKELDTVFIIARISGKELVPEKVIPGISADLEDGQDLDFTTFVEQFDFDGDGIDEIVVENRGYETKSFTVWKRKNGKWEAAGGGGGSGC